MTDMSAHLTAHEGAVLADGPDVADYFALLKPRVMSLVVYSGLVGLLLAPGTIHPVIAVIAVLCIAVGAGASGAINMWYERDLDARMTRTANRPLPAGRMEPGQALGFGSVLAVGSVTVMALGVNWAAAALLALSIGFYVFIYTIWLKRRTPQNIVIGGAAGAFPPMIGWAAVTGDVSWMPVALFAIIFLWTPPHFWALALYRGADYARAGVPMLPVVAGAAETKTQIVVYTMLLLAASTVPWLLGGAGVAYLAVAILLGAVFLVLALRLRASTGPEGFEEGQARKLFGYSILYLFLLLTMLVSDHYIAGLV